MAKWQKAESQKTEFEMAGQQDNQKIENPKSRKSKGSVQNQSSNGPLGACPLLGYQLLGHVPSHTSRQTVKYEGSNKTPRNLIRISKSIEKKVKTFG